MSVYYEKSAPLGSLRSRALTPRSICGHRRYRERHRWLVRRYEASKQGARVAVIDRGPIGRGLTARTSAHLTSALDDFYHEFFPIRGEEIGKLHFASQAAAINRIDEIRTAERIACDFKRLPTYLFLAGEVEPKAPDDEREALETVGLEGSRVDLSPEIFHKLSDGPCVIIPEQRQVPSP